MTQPQECHARNLNDGLLTRIRGISVANAVIGTAEFAAGMLTNSSTLTMAGVHDLSDAGLYGLKHKAACETDPARKRRLRQAGAVALMSATIGFGAYEISSSFTDEHHQPAASAATIGILAAGVNIAAVGAMHGRRHQHDARDTWKHVAGVDLPGALTTLVTVPLSVKYPEVDIVGSAIHMTLATVIGASTLRSASSERHC